MPVPPLSAGGLPDASSGDGARRRFSRRAALGGVAAASAAALGLVVPDTAPAIEAASPKGGERDGPRVRFTRWTTWLDFAKGESAGVIAVPGDRRGIVMAASIGETTYADPTLKTTRRYEYATWTSPPQRLDFGATRLTAHWNATTPTGTFLKIELLAEMTDGHEDTWVMGIWASGDADIARASVKGQKNARGEIDTDTWNAAAGKAMRAYRLRATLYRVPGAAAGPRLWQLGAVASLVEERTTVPASRPGPATGIDLTVVPYAQNIHTGQYEKYGGGGEAWCSPTSTEMIVEYWGHKPTGAEMAWIDAKYADPSVDYAARYTYDYAYDGTGNWPFNTAYAAGYGLDAMVVRLNSLTELEVLIAAGFPVATSQSFTKAEMGFYSTDGHLWVVRGFTGDGDVIVNDPASNSDANVYTVYKRRAFETVWLRTAYAKEDGTRGTGSGGIAYVIKPHNRALPPVVDPLNPSWPGGSA
jgi:hypothetical protein